MASAPAAGRDGTPPRLRILPAFLILAAVFGAIEYVIELIPGFLFTNLHLGAEISPYEVAVAALRVGLVPVALFVVFYLFSQRRPLDLKRSYLSLAVSIFLGTLVVFVPVDLAQAATGSLSPGFTPPQAVVISAGNAITSSLNHVFIGFAGVFVWQLVSRPPSAAAYFEPRKERLHGTEDVHIVGIVMVAVYAWQYLAQAYESTYLLGLHDPFPAFFASLLLGGSPSYYVAAVYQQFLLIAILPFVLYFLVVRSERLNPFVQAGKIALVVFVWAIFLRLFTPYFYVYFGQSFDPSAFAGKTIVSTVSGEFELVNLIPIIGSSFTFVFLGLTASVFGFFSRERSSAVVGERRPDEAPSEGIQLPSRAQSR